MSVQCQGCTHQEDGGVDETVVHIIAEHNHERMDVLTVGLDDGMKQKVAGLYKVGYTGSLAPRAQCLRHRGKKQDDYLLE